MIYPLIYPFFRYIISPVHSITSLFCLFIRSLNYFIHHFIRLHYSFIHSFKNPIIPSIHSHTPSFHPFFNHPIISSVHSTTPLFYSISCPHYRFIHSFNNPIIHTFIRISHYFIHSFAHSITLFILLTQLSRPFIRPPHHFIHSFAYSIISSIHLPSPSFHSFIQSPNYFIHSFSHLIISSIHSPTLLFCSFICSLNHFVHLFNHPIILLLESSFILDIYVSIYSFLYSFLLVMHDDNNFTFIKVQRRLFLSQRRSVKISYINIFGPLFSLYLQDNFVQFLKILLWLYQLCLWQLES